MTGRPAAALRATTVAAGVLLAGGCAHQLVIGTAAPSSSSLTRPGQGDVTHAEEWPDACALLTDEDLRALLPEHQGVERTPSGVTVLDPDFMSEDNQTGDAPRGSCDFWADHGQGKHVTISITIAAVASPGVVRDQYAADRAGALEEKTEYETVKDVDGTGATACFLSGSHLLPHLHCHHKWLAFDVSALGLGEVPDIPADQTDQALVDRLLPEVVRTVAAKLR